MFRRVVPAVIAVGLVVALGSAAPLKPDPAKPTADPDFAGKFVLVAVKDAEKHALVLENARVKRLGSREFLLGEHVNLKGERPVEATYWTPLDEVDYLMEFKTLDAVKKMYEGRRKDEKEGNAAPPEVIRPQAGK
jgi:hypothetical protein